jgi:putative YhdH/YhfP family quinone oxidoreductase
MPSSFAAAVVREQADGSFIIQEETRSLTELPPGDVLIRVHYSSLNYKDALSASGHKGITKKYPHVPGIDAAGIVEESAHPDWHPGDSVIVTGHDQGMARSGGWSQYLRVPAAWPVRLPPGLSLRDSMMLGTAGLTAAQMVEALADHEITPRAGEILVTGATGGVGSLAVGILSRLGYRVIAVTGKKTHHPLLKQLGAAEILDRSELSRPVKKALLGARWAGVIDTVGGPVLDNALRATAYHGVVTCCGMIGSTELNTSIYPFILRGITLLGVDTAECPPIKRTRLWQHLATDWKPTLPSDWIHEISLGKLPAAVQQMRDGLHTGRTIVRL